jgi:hypothetical protein
VELHTLAPFGEGGGTGEETNETMLCMPMACMLTGRSFWLKAEVV